MHPTTIGSFQVLRELGRGGMGEVYLARDTKLDRQVAIKALPADVAEEPDRLARFQREAKVLASLNHPGIGAIYGLEEVQGRQYLILEFVEGETLANRLRRGAIPVDEALTFAKQIAESLEVAHEKGVIHRDLKPGNIMVTPEGVLKVLDFGLARTDERPSWSASSPGFGDSPTVTPPVQGHSPTIPGAIMGTAGYMSPEQARGKPVDKRSDIFSFGSVLYEMLTGTETFPGETVTDSLGAIVHREPDWTRLPTETPLRVRELLTICLAKDKKNRLRDIGDARLAIQHAHAAPSGSFERPARWTSANGLPWMVAGTCVALLAAGVIRSQLGSVPPAPALALRSTIEITPGSLIDDGEGPVALSPDGRTLAYVGRVSGETPRIWIRPLDSLSVQPLQGTDNATFPFWSPDGNILGYFSNGKLRRIPAAGGTPVALADVEEPRGGSWSVDGIIVFAPGPSSALMRISATGGTPVPITELDAERQTHRLPCFLPDGMHLLYSSGTGVYDEANCEIRLLNLESGKSVSLMNVKSLGFYAAPGHLLFARNSALLAQRLDVAAHKLLGEPVVLAEQVSMNIERFASPISASSNGMVVYRPLPSVSRLEWFDAEGRSLGAFGEPADFASLDIAPDGGQALAVIRREGGQADLWIVDTIRGTRVLFVENVGDTQAFWCPASTGTRKIAYWTPTDETHIRETEGNMTDSVLAEGFVADWSRDGTTISIVRQTRDTNTDIYLMDVSSGEVRPYLVTTDWEEFGVFSPDGKWIAYSSTRSGKMELFVAPISNPAAARPIAPFTRNCFLGWLDDGSLIYSDPMGAKLFVVTTRINESGIELGTPNPAFGGMELPANFYTVARDGKRLLAAVPVNKNKSESLVLIQNWQALTSVPR